MHTDLSSHLHSEKCIELIKLLEQCRAESPFTKFFGKCNDDYRKMLRCLKEERIERQQKNYEKSLEMKARLRRRFQEDREKTQNSSQEKL